ncbi:MAG: glycerate kinase [Vampirovibrionales bacterium]|nr:glycerate kinase [Vampirovibrionales bacterium]
MPPLKLLISPNAFKGSVSSLEASRLFLDAFSGWASEQQIPAEIKCLPVADGGDDTLCVLADASKRQGRAIERHTSPVMGPIEQLQVNADWLYLPAEKTVIIEAARIHGMAILQASGLPLEPLGATSYGVGELIRQVIKEKQPETLVLALGGSASTDGGLGALQALGVSLLDTSEKLLPKPFCPRFFEGLSAIDLPVGTEGFGFQGLKRLLIATDTVNPLLGKRGTAYTFAPQKGASPEQCDWLELQLEKTAIILSRAFATDYQDAVGAGAAGGLGYGLLHLPNAQIISGFQWLSESLGLEAALKDCDVLLTGEGCFDATSLTGKAVGELLAMAEANGKPVILLCGAIEQKIRQTLPASVFTIALNDYVSTDQAILYPQASIQQAIAKNATTLLRWFRSDGFAD